MRHIALLLSLVLLCSPPLSAATPASSWFGFRPRDVAVTLTSTPPGAQVHLVASGGTKRLLGTTATPLVVALPPGDHRFVFDLPGHVPLTRAENLTGSTATVEAILRPGTTRRWTVPIGFHTVVYDRGPDGRTRILPSTLATPSATSAPPPRRPVLRDERGLAMLPPLPPPSRAAVEEATRTSTTTDDFYTRHDILKRAVGSASYADLGCCVTQKDVYVLDVLFNVNPKKACVRLDAALGKLAAAMTKDR